MCQRSRSTAVAIFSFVLFFLFLLMLGPSRALGESAPGLMATQGKFEVDEIGGATFTVPIAVPSGAGGMQPALSLVYSSRGGNGIFGMGWSLAGLSAITRCPATVEQDGFFDPQDYSATDRFCLDGQRLQSIAGSTTEYRTERDAFMRVTSYGAQGVGPVSWAVKTKSGLTLQLGATADARIEGKGTASVRVWAVNRVTDSVGNAMTIAYFDYSATAGQFYPRSITYGSNHVVFDYEVRPDVTRVYLAGGEIRTDYRVRAIRTLYGSYLVRSMSLAYGAAPGTGRSRLTSIRECGIDGTTCLAPLSVAWSDLETHRWAATGNPAGADGALAGHGYEAGDFNGDGFTDFLWIKKRSDGTAEGTAPIHLWQGWAGGFTSRGPLPYPNVYDGYMAHVADFNGDGRADVLWDHKLGDGRSWDQRLRILWWGQEDGTFHGQYLDSTAGRMEQYKLIVAELNGDGRADILWLRGLPRGGRVDDYPAARHELWYGRGDGTFTENRNLFGGAIPHRYLETVAYVADFNADGLADIFWDRKQEDGRTEDWADGNATRDLWLNKGEGKGWQIFYRVRPTNGAFEDYNLRLADLNGDGATDLFWFHGHADGRAWTVGRPRQIWFSKAAGAFDVVQNPAGKDGAYDDHRPLFTDLNGDGLGDVIWNAEDQDGRTNGSRDLWLGNGLGGFTIVAGFGGSLHGWTLTPLDLNGDSLLDFFWDRTDGDGRTNGTRAAWFNQSQWGAQAPDQVTRLTDGLGTAIDIGLKPLTFEHVYTKEATSRYPFVDFRSPLHVTWWTQITNAAGGSNVTGYWYQGAKLHQQGRGFVGFHKMVAWEAATGLATWTTYDQTGRFTAGMPTSTEVTQADGRRLKYVGNAFAQVETIAAAYPHSIAFPYIATSVEDVHDLDSAALVTRVASTRTTDVYGNPTSITVATSGGHAKTTTSTYANDAAKWHLGRLTRAVVVARAPGQPDVTRTSSLTYDAATALVAAEVIEPDDSFLQLATAYARDAFGNKRSSTVTGHRIHPARTTTVSWGSTGRFPEVTKNALGHQEVKTYDLRLGVVKSLRGPNGLTTTWDYDALGRKIRETRADGTTTAWSHALCNCGPEVAGERRGRYTVTTTPAGGAPVTMVHDAFGREVRRSTYGFKGQAIFKDTEYDLFGRVVRTSRSYYATATPEWSSFDYDLLGRVKRETDPDGSVAQTSYAGLATAVRVFKSATDAVGQTTHRLRNSQDQVVRVTDAAGWITSYAYDATGNLVSIVDAHGNQTRVEYDRRGRKMRMVDPDMGEWYYEAYTGAGELLRQRNLRQPATPTVMTYDALGRMTSRADADGTSTWTYDQPGTKGIGKLWKAAVAMGPVREVAYDAYGRASTVKTILDGTTYTLTTSYDTSGRPSRTTYPTGFAVQNVYTGTFGHLWKVAGVTSPGTVYWEALDADPDGKVTLERLGNGVTTSRTYDPSSGTLQSLDTAAVDGTTLQNAAYVWDELGNLTARADLRRPAHGIHESFAYDRLNRLVATRLCQPCSASGEGTTVQTQAFAYDEIGNLTSKTGLGTLDYSGPRPHAVKQVSDPQGGPYHGAYTYDANGNMTSGAGRTVTYTAFDNVLSITKGGATTTFTYGADRERVKAVTQDPAMAETVLYVGGLFEKVLRANETILRHYVGPFAVHTVTNGAPELRYLHQDHLGSTEVVTSATGAVLERFSYDAWGRRRARNWVAPLTWDPPIFAHTTDQGFTGHQHFDLVGVVHMNGRVYDPTLGRFLTADPHVQEPFGPQSLNRYSYVLNNPLSSTDPTGFFFEKIGKWFQKHWRTIVGAVAAIVVTVVSYGALSWLGGVIFSAATMASSTATFAVGAIAGAAAGATNAAITGGDPLRAALMGGIIGGVSALVLSGVQGFLQDQGTLYEVSPLDNADLVTGKDYAVTRVDQVVSGDVFVNGIRSDVGYSAESGLKQLATGSSRTGFTSFHNPTRGFVEDITESVLDKVGLRSSLSRQLAGVLEQNVSRNLNVASYSQGSLITTSALEHLAAQGVRLSNHTFYFTGSPASLGGTQAAVKGVGARFGGYFVNTFDGVSVIAGGSSANPVRILGSLVTMPCSFSMCGSYNNHVYGSIR